MRIQLLAAAVFAFVLATPAHGVTTLRRSTIAGGATGATSLHHQIRSTAGQTVVATGSSAHHAVHSGFWWPGQFSSDLAESSGSSLRFALRSVFPNPFSSSTEIRYDVPALGGEVSLRVYDVSGRLVRELVRGARSAGSYRVAWNGADDSGRRVGSGLYLLIFAASGHESTRKLVLLP